MSNMDLEMEKFCFEWYIAYIPLKELPSRSCLKNEYNNIVRNLTVIGSKLLFLKMKICFLLISWEPTLIHLQLPLDIFLQQICNLACLAKFWSVLCPSCVMPSQSGFWSPSQQLQVIGKEEGNSQNCATALFYHMLPWKAHLAFPWKLVHCYKYLYNNECCLLAGLAIILYFLVLTICLTFLLPLSYCQNTCLTPKFFLNIVVTLSGNDLNPIHTKA